VIGGLLLATVATLFFVPASFSVVHGWLESRRRTAHGAPRAGTIDEFDELSE
jgi:antibiotic biosynthesis monooxygenase (ABM) superfamily enzyme